MSRTRVIDSLYRQRWRWKLSFWNFGYKDWSKISNSNLRNVVIDGIFEELNFREDSMMGALRKWSTSAINLILRSPPPSTLRAATWPRQASLPLYEWSRGDSTWTYTCAMYTLRHRRWGREGGQEWTRCALVALMRNQCPAWLARCDE